MAGPPRPYGVGPYGVGPYSRSQGLVISLAARGSVEFTGQAFAARAFSLAVRGSVEFSARGSAAMTGNLHAPRGWITFSVAAARLEYTWTLLTPCEGGVWTDLAPAAGSWTSLAPCETGTWSKAA